MLIKLLIAIDRSIQLPNTQSVKHRMPKNHENQLVRDSEIFWAHVRFQSCPRPAPTNGHQNTCSIVYSIQSTDKQHGVVNLFRMMQLNSVHQHTLHLRPPPKHFRAGIRPKNANLQCAICRATICCEQTLVKVASNFKLGAEDFLLSIHFKN